MKYLYIIYYFDDVLNCYKIVAYSTDYYYIRRLMSKYDYSVFYYKKISIDNLILHSIPYSW